MRKITGLKNFLEFTPRERICFYPGAGVDFNAINNSKDFFIEPATFIYCDIDGVKLRNANPEALPTGLVIDISFIDNQLGLYGLTIEEKEEVVIIDEFYNKIQEQLTKMNPRYTYYKSAQIKATRYRLSHNHTDTVVLYYLVAEAVALRKCLLECFPENVEKLSVYLQAFTGGWLPQNDFNNLAGPLLSPNESDIPVLMHTDERQYFCAVNPDLCNESTSETYENIFAIYRNEETKKMWQVKRILRFT